MDARVFLAVVLVAAAAATSGFAQERGKGRPAHRASAKQRLIDAKVRAEERLYRTAPEGKLYLHLYYPSDWKAADQRPAIVFFFGGAWKKGSYRQFVPQAEYFASRGLVAASADYRIASLHGTTPAESVEDAKSAVRWLRSHAKELGVDPNKIIAAGGSAGGHLAACTALLTEFDAADDDTNVSCVPNALVLFNPVLNLTLIKDRRAGGQNRELMRRLSPTLKLQKSTLPAVLFYGSDDKFLKHGEEYAANAKDIGVQAELYVATGEAHSFFNRPPWTAVTTRKADEFLESLGYLKGEPTIQLPKEAAPLKRQ
jgi:acetyl esterase/lipase